MTLQEKLEAKKLERADAINKASEAVEKDELDSADELLAAVEAFDKAIAQLEKLEVLSAQESDEIEETVDAKVEETEKQKNDDEKGVRKFMKNTVTAVDALETTKTKEVRSFIEHIQSKSKEARSITTLESEAIIPIQVITKAQEQPTTVVDLRDFANVVKVETKSGSYPVFNGTDAVLPTAEELAENPDLEDPTFKDVDYKIQTRRGVVLVSEEALDDADNLEALISKHVNRIALNTSNKAIANVLAKAPAVAATSLDELKAVFNTKLDPQYNSMIVASQSFLQLVDTLKDGNGRYILQQDITQPSAYILFGRKMVILKDTVLGKAGEAKAFVGDVEAFVLFADRKNITMKWAEERKYGEYLQAVLRFDAVVADDAAGYLFNLSLPAPEKAAK